MRRKDREVSGQNGIEDIIKKCSVCHVAMVDKGKPYIVPLSFGYEIESGTLTLYFHSAEEGKKIDILRENHKVCFEMSYRGAAVETDIPCSFGYDYASVIGNGEVFFIDNPSEKCRVLSLLMKHQADWDADFSEEQTRNLCIYKIISKDFIGKKRS